MCVRGASALGEVLKRHPGADIRVVVIWLPVLVSDTGPPTKRVRGPLQDRRVIEYWDPDRWASPKMMQRATMMVHARGEEPDFDPEGVAWDLIALFPPGTVWEEPFPAPSWYGAPVVDALEEVEDQVSALN